MHHIVRLIFLMTLLCTISFAQRARINTEPVTPHQVTNLEVNTNSVATGLHVVPNQTYVYLSAENIGNEEEITAAVFSLTSKPAGSAAELEVINETWVQFKPDSTGTYTVQLSLTTASGTHDTTANIYSASFVGVGGFDGVESTFPNCMTCHSSGAIDFTDIYDNWKSSGHANIFQEQLETSDHYSTSCMKCHTTGYDHNVAAANNGFDDLAATLGWSYSAPSHDQKWDSLKTQFPEMVNFATIGCESCHGPGSIHAIESSIPKKQTIAVSVKTGACASCHDEPWRHNKVSEYENSLHSESVWERTTGSNAGTNSLNDCIRCHDGQAFVNFTKGRSTDEINLEEFDGTRITCAACHDPHGNGEIASLRQTPAGSDTLGNGYQYTIGGTGMICMNCHKARRDNVSYTQTNVTSSHWGPHSSVQTDVLLGQNAAQFGDTEYASGWHRLAVKNSCVECHMAPTTPNGTDNRDKVGGHSFKLHNEETDYDHVTYCGNCHGDISSFEDFIADTDYDGDGSVESVRQEISGLEALLRYYLPPSGVDSIDYNLITTPELKKAFWNYSLIADDGSGGMHNAEFAIDVLTRSIMAIGGTVAVKENNMDILPKEYSLAQNYPNPFNPSTTIKYTLPFDSKVKITVYSITGEIIKELVNTVLMEGPQEAVFNSEGMSLASGIYFYTIEATAVSTNKSFRETKKMVLMK